MLKRSIIALLLLSGPALAQSPPAGQPDPADLVAAYKALLQEANDRVAAMSAQAQANARKAKAAEDDLAAARAKK